ncbi:MAG: NADH-quinone oxidoreductase subunit NuoE [Anaerolineae bacterium]
MVTEGTNVTAEETIDLTLMDPVLEKYQGQEGTIIPVLQATQEIYGYLPSDAMRYLSRKLRVPLSQLYGVATFYAQFYLQRRGRHVIRICDGTACHVLGAAQIVNALEKDLGIKAGETTDDYRVTLEVVFCLGSCGLAPIAVLDDQVVGRLTPQKAVGLVRELE